MHTTTVHKVYGMTPFPEGSILGPRRPPPPKSIIGSDQVMSSNDRETAHKSPDKGIPRRNEWAL